MTVGFGLFLVLTVVAAYAAPSPFSLGADAVARLEAQLTHLRSAGLGGLAAHLPHLEALHFAEWEGHLSHALQYSRDSLADLPPRALKVTGAKRCSFQLQLVTPGHRVHMWCCLHDDL